MFRKIKWIAIHDPSIQTLNVQIRLFKTSAKIYINSIFERVQIGVFFYIRELYSFPKFLSTKTRFMWKLVH